MTQQIITTAQAVVYDRMTLKEVATVLAAAAAEAADEAQSLGGEHQRLLALEVEIADRFAFVDDSNGRAQVNVTLTTQLT